MARHPACRGEQLWYTNPRRKVHPEEGLARMAVNRRMKLTPELVALVHRSIPDTGPNPGFVPMEEEDYERLADEILKDHPRHDDLWIFAYGSLMWRPACEIDGQEIALLNGWHRKFCIRISRWRGTPENPGLMMALDRGGSCRAVVQRLAAKTARARFDQLLRRETTSKEHPTNRPRWVTVQSGSQQRRAIVFSVVRSSPYYSGNFSLEETAAVLSRAVGHWGSGAEYLMNTVKQLENLGVHDRNLWRLQELVAARIAAHSEVVATPAL
jgi:cation transport protein ChaC